MNQDIVAANMDFVGRLIAIVENRLQGGFWICELPSRETRWSDGMFELLDVDRATTDPVLGSVNARVHIDDRLSQSELEMIVSSGTTVDRTMKVVTDKGRLRWVSKHIEFVMDARGTPKRMIGILFDIGLEIELRQAVTAHRQRFNVLADAATLLVWSAGQDGRVERISGWAALTGLPEQRSNGGSWAAGVHPEDRDGVVDAWRTAVASGKPYERELRLLKRDGGHLWVLARASPVRSANGCILEWIGAAIDIHARKEWVMDPDNAMTVTGAQIRGARGLLNWSVNRLGSESSVPASAIRRLEEFDGLTKGQALLLEPIKTCLQHAGVEFIFPPNGKPGVRPA